ncbi:hypothetical protein RUM43_002812 [Polyplax serrata]|uniref:Uncharacterized protein n=1 Tax=Polyplax serrata TaxID=468196 RepID=A0AAN8NVE2_POLSC
MSAGVAVPKDLGPADEEEEVDLVRCVFQRYPGTSPTRGPEFPAFHGMAPVGRQVSLVDRLPKRRRQIVRRAPH